MKRRLRRPPPRPTMFGLRPGGIRVGRGV